MIHYIQNLKIRLKLYILVGVALAGMLIIGGMSFSLMGRMNDMTSDISTSWLPSIDTARELTNTLSNIRLNELGYLTAISEEVEASSLQYLQKEKENMDTLLAAYKEAAGEDKLEIQYVKYCQARIGRLRMRQDASLDLEARGQLAGETERLLQEAESLTIPKRGRGMLLSRVELGILLAETEGIGLDEMQNIQDFVREYYNMEWKEEYLPQVHLKYANLLAGEGKYGRALAEIQRGLASIRSGESYGHCADLYFLSAQIAGRMGWERLGKEEQKELARKCWRAYSLYSLDGSPRAEAVREYMETSGLMALAPESLL